jgi:hypothetical protein
MDVHEEGTVKLAPPKKSKQLLRHIVELDKDGNPLDECLCGHIWDKVFLKHGEDILPQNPVSTLADAVTVVLNCALCGSVGDGPLVAVGGRDIQKVCNTCCKIIMNAYKSQPTKEMFVQNEEAQ